jgi:hypothetical protein
MYQKVPESVRLTLKTAKEEKIIEAVMFDHM